MENDNINEEKQEKEKLIDGKKLLLFLGLFLFHEIISALLAARFLKFFCTNILHNYYDGLLQANVLLYNILASLFCAAFLICIYYKYLKEKFIDFKNNFGRYLGISIKNWIIGLVIMIVSNLVISSIVGLGTAENEAAVQNMITSNKILALFLTSILAPFIEEIIYRKGIFDVVKIKKYYPIISGLVFGGIHVIGSSTLAQYLYIIPYGALGYFFAKSYVETDNVYTSITSHFLHNLMCTLLSF